MKSSWNIVTHIEMFFLCLVDELLNTTFPFFARENSDDIYGEREAHMQTY